MNEILYQIALMVVIVAGIALIFVLWRAYLVLTDINDSTKVVRRRVRDLDQLISSLESLLSVVAETVKAFTGSMERVKGFTSQMKNFFENKKEKGKSNEQE